jgi:hypothetical protein
VKVFVGDNDAAAEGDIVVALIGPLDGEVLGVEVTFLVGDREVDSVGPGVAAAEGATVVALIGPLDGEVLGVEVTFLVGDSEWLLGDEVDDTAGPEVGDLLPAAEGATVVALIGPLDGEVLGVEVTFFVGCAVGNTTG